MRASPLLCLCLSGGITLGLASLRQEGLGLPTVAEEKIIGYGDSSDLTDPVAELGRAIRAGKVSLKFEKNRGYLKNLLRRLGIETSSQTLVFSKTSSQSALIGPATPR